MSIDRENQNCMILPPDVAAHTHSLQRNESLPKKKHPDRQQMSNFLRNWLHHSPSSQTSFIQHPDPP